MLPFPQSQQGAEFLAWLLVFTALRKFVSRVIFLQRQILHKK